MARTRTRVGAGLAIGAACAAAAACGGDGGAKDPGPVTAPRLLVRFVLPPASAPDPFEDVEEFEVTLRDDDDDVIVSESFDAGEPLSLPGLEPTDSVYLVLEAFDDDDDLVSRGRTLLFDLTDEDAEVSMYFARVHTFNDVSGNYEPRAAQSVAVFSDGRVLIAGGIEGDSTPSTRAEIYDPVTDTVTPTASLGTALSFPVAVLVEDDVVLVAGGRDEAGDPSRAAQVFVYSPASATGSWTPGVPRMAEPHADFAAASIGGGRALIAGGEDASGNPNDVTEIFTWDGGPGSWVAGPVMDRDRLGPIVIAAGNGQAIVGGGFRENGDGTAIESYADCTTFTGSDFASESGFENDRAWSGIVEIEPGDWLLFGGLRGNLPGTPEERTERLGWDGAAVTHADAADLPSPRRRGGGGRMGHGEVVVMGGDTSGHGQVFSPIDSVLVYDPDADAFEPFGASPGATVSATVVPLPDGTTFVVTDGKATRYNPRP